MIVSLRIKPNYSDIVSASNITDNFQLTLTGMAIKNKGLLMKNVNDAITFLGNNDKYISFNSVYFDADDISKDLVNEALDVAKLMEVPLSYYESNKYGSKDKYIEEMKKIKKMADRKEVKIFFQNPEGFCIKDLVSYFFSNDLNISLNIPNYLKECREYKEEFKIIAKNYMGNIFNLIVDYSDLENMVSFEFKEILKVFSENKFVNNIILNINSSINLKNNNVVKNLGNIIDTIKSLFGSVKKKNGLIMFDADYTLYEIYNKSAYSKMYNLLERITKQDKDKLIELHKSIINKLKESKIPEKRTLNYSLNKIVNDKELVEDIVEIFWNEISKNIIPRKYLKEVIKELSYDYDIVVFSDEFESPLTMKLSSAFPEWKEYIKELITPEKTKAMKPSIKYYTYASKKYRYKNNNIYVVGDSWKRDLELAKKRGHITFLIERENQKDLFDRLRTLKEDRGSPDYIVENLKELKNILQKINGN